MKVEKSKLINCILVSFVFAFNICIFAPLEFYYSNIFDLWFTIDHVLPIIIIFDIMLFTILVVIIYFSKGKLHDFFIKSIFVLMICLYIQGNYLNIGYEVLDGSEIDWNSMIGKGIINAIIWIFIIIFVFILSKKIKNYKKIFNIGSLFIFGIQIITLFVIIYMANAYSADTNLVLNSSFYLDSSKIFELSNEENIIVFVSDTFEATYMNEILNKYPEYKEKLKDFIYYDNTTATSLMTYSAMPTILTGESCQVGKNLKQNIKYCFDNTDLYETLMKNNYDVELYTDVNLVPADETNITNKIDKEMIIDNSSKFKLTQLLYDCVLYKYLPHFLKYGFVVDTADFNKITSTEVNQYGFDDVKFYNQLNSNGITTIKNKKYKLYHLNGVHTPYTVDEYIKYNITKEYLSLDEETRRENQVIASLKIFIKYVEMLKKSNCYENSTIILLADHGWENRYHINFMIKPKDYNYDFSISHAPISMSEDFIPTILNIATKTKEHGKDIFDYSENESRKRNIYNYTFTRGDNTYNVLSKVIVSTEKKADDIEGYYISKEEYVNSNEIPKKQYKLGKEIDIVNNKNMNYVVLNGILNNDIRTISRGTNMGKEAQIRIRTEKTDSDIQANITINKVYNDYQTIKISVEDKLLFESQFNVFDSGKEIKFEIPKEIWNSNDVLELNLQFPNGKLGNPSALGEETLFMSMGLGKIIFNK